MPKPRIAVGGDVGPEPVGMRFTRPERRLAKKLGVRCLRQARPFGTLERLPGGGRALIHDDALLDFIDEVAFRCLLAGGDVQYVRVPDEIAMKRPGAKERAAVGIDRLWYAIAFDLTGRITGASVWIGLSEGTTPEEERAEVVGRLRAELIENLRSGAPSRSPGPRLAVLNT
ncbi:hypothetical protein [Pseudooceanicola nanhaiensis]|uniref:hypothetical protein n=1 Tax=Pseudooceanicola nanhaiensis TaxID=375761 RepID=UPI0035150CBD